MKFLEGLDHAEVKKWFDAKLGNREPFFYTSVDLRDSGFKVAPVDTNLFPAGFNNLSAEAIKAGVVQTKEYISKYRPDVKKVAILAENFSRNKFYWDNITALRNIIEQAGLEVAIAVNKDMPDTAETNDGVQLQLSKIEIIDEKLKAGNTIPDLIISNRDFTSGTESYFSEISQPVIPPISMGWHTRRKSNHFASYDILAKDFANHFNFDPWLITTVHYACDHIDFKKGEGLDCVATSVEKAIHKIRQKYEEYGVKDDPYVYVKSDSGTFGMGIMTVKSGSEIYEMNKKLRNKMDRIKEGVQNTEVIIQEGVPTSYKVDGKTAEPFLYLINTKPIGAILRVNENRDEYGNLNSAGMSFAPANCSVISGPCEFSPLGIIARLASLATLYEAEHMAEAA